MFFHEATIVIRNILLVQLLTIVFVPNHVVLVTRELMNFWRSIHAPFSHKKKTPKNRNRFWEIDMTKFEP